MTHRPNHGGGGGYQAWFAQHERDTGTTLTPIGPGVARSSDGSIVRAPGYEDTPVDSSEFPALNSTNQPSFEGSFLPDYPFNEFFTPAYVDTFGIASNVAAFNAGQIGPAAEDAVFLSDTLNTANVDQFLDIREQVLPGTAQAQSDALQLGQDLTNFQLPQGFVNLLRRNAASQSLAQGGGLGGFAQNRFFSTLGTAGLNAALQGANLAAGITRANDAMSRSLMVDIGRMFGTSFDSRRLSNTTAFQNEQFNSNLDFQIDSALAANSRFIASQAQRSNEIFFEAERQDRLTPEPPDNSASVDYGRLAEAGRDIFFPDGDGTILFPEGEEPAGGGGSGGGGSGPSVRREDRGGGSVPVIVGIERGTTGGDGTNVGTPPFNPDPNERIPSDDDSNAFIDAAGNAGRRYVSSASQSGAGGVAGAGAGVVGSAIGSEINDALGGGETSGTGAAIGGTVGSYFGPVGTAVGSALGEVVEGVFSRDVPEEERRVGGSAGWRRPDIAGPQLERQEVLLRRRERGDWGENRYRPTEAWELDAVRNDSIDNMLADNNGWQRWRSFQRGRSRSTLDEDMHGKTVQIDGYTIRHGRRNTNRAGVTQPGEIVL